MKIAFIILGSLVGLVLIITAIGAMQPRDHVATMTATIGAPPEKVWAAITDVGAFSTWRTDVKKAEVITHATAKLAWREENSEGGMTLVAEVFEPPRRMVARISDEGMPFGGAWEYSVAPDGADSAKSRVTITERGWVSNYIFRFVSRFIMGHHSSIDAYLRALSRKFGPEVAPQRV